MTDNPSQELSDVVQAESPYTPPTADCSYDKHIPQKNILEYVLDGVDIGLNIASVLTFPIINLIGPIAVYSITSDSDSAWVLGFMADFTVPLSLGAVIGAAYGKSQHLLGYTKPKEE
ncbi:MAG: hypothetical protein Q8R37_02345 [Nanoarchaeota archaeon]|nr:hypothetical protein [Nanoarchaeota archaeon]